MEPLFPEWIAQVSGGVWTPRPPAQPLRAVCVDSRTAAAGSLFFALPGGRTDGHEYLAAAAAVGAAAVIRADWPESRLPANGCFLRAENPLAALGRLAAAYRRQMPARLVGITGSVGKTLTKELTADFLGTRARTVRTAGNFNNDIGLPLSLLQLDRDCHFGVFEAGISHPGDMTRLRDILQPDAAMVTCIGPAHIEFFGTERAIAEEKAVLLERLPAEGFAVLNADDAQYEAVRAHSSARVVCCSLAGRDADYVGVAEGRRLTIVERGRGERAVLPLPPPGGFMALNVLLAAAVARQYGIEWPALAAALEDFKPVGMRWAVETVGGWTAINDGYNANPLSLRAALRAFAEWPAAGKKYLAVGAMLELGAHAEAAHEQLGREIATGNWAGVAILAGETAPARAGAAALQKGLGAAPGSAVAFHVAETPAAAADWLRERLQPGDALLLKASRGVKIERVLGELKKDR